MADPTSCGKDADPRDGSLRAMVVFLVLVKLYGLAVLYVLFLRTPMKDEEVGFIFLPRGQLRTERVEEIRDSFWHRLTPYDGQWYQDIALKGYRRLTGRESLGGKLPAGNYAFFPLLPLLIRGVESLLGAVYLPVALVLTIAASAGGALVLWFLARELRVDAWLAVVLLVTFPSAAFQLVLYTEGLFLLLSGLALFFAIRRRVLPSGLFGGLAGLCRPQGILLLLPLAVELLGPRSRGGESRSAPLLGRVAAALMPLSGFAVMAAHHSVAFVEIQGAWGRSYGPLNVLDALGAAVGYGGPPADMIGLALGIALLPMMWRRLPVSFALYGTGAVLLPLLTGSLLSFGRFLSVSIPHFLCLSIWLEKRPRLRNVVIVAFVVFQVLLAKGLMGWYLVG